MTTDTCHAWLRRGLSETRGAAHEVAQRSFRRAAILDPAAAAASYALGHVAILGGDWAEARSRLTRALLCLRRADPPHLPALVACARGVASRHLDRRSDARCDYRRALVAAPADPQAASNLATTALWPPSLPAAPAFARRAAILNPRSATAWNDLGAALNNTAVELRGVTGRTTLAYRRALLIEPAHSTGWNNLGMLDKRLDQIDGAIGCFQRAVITAPSNPHAWPNLGRNLLLQGRFAEGWPALEHNRRVATGMMPASGAFALPLWDGGPVSEGALLIWSEERIGDDILFATQLDDVVARAGRVLLLCNPRLETLFRRALPDIAVVPWNGRPPLPKSPQRATTCYPLEFVGRFVRRRFADFPPPRPYLRRAIAKPALLPQRPGLTIGLSWHSTNRSIGDHKSQPLASWAPILKLPGIRFVSLQYGDTANEIADVERDLGVRVEAVAERDQIANLEGFCELVAGLDLVITIPGTTAHVAGALGVPTWVMLPAGPGLSWFWFRDRDTALWYQGNRLFRQTQVRNWRPVVQAVADALARLSEPHPWSASTLPAR